MAQAAVAVDRKTEESPPAQAPAVTGYTGVPFQSCATWVAQEGPLDKRSQSDAIRTITQNFWLAGYVSGVGQTLASPLYARRVTALRPTDAEGLSAWVTRYCREHPTETVNSAAAELVRHLMEEDR